MGGSIDNNGNTRPGKVDSVELGRNLLADWGLAQPTNLFAIDVNLQRSLEFHWGRENYTRHANRLYSFGETMAQIVDSAVREANLTDNLPRLDRFDGIGRRIENVIFHPQHHTAGLEEHRPRAHAGADRSGPSTGALRQRLGGRARGVARGDDLDPDRQASLREA